MHSLSLSHTRPLHTCMRQQWPKTKSHPIDRHTERIKNHQPFLFDFICNSRILYCSICGVIFRWWLLFSGSISGCECVSCMLCTRTSISNANSNWEFGLFVVFLWISSNSNQTDCELLAFLSCSFLPRLTQTHCFVLKQKQSIRSVD